MISKNAPRATAYESRRINRMKADIGCICCLLRTGVPNYHVEVHHILRGNKRLGHWYTLPLCRTHHRIRGNGGIFTSVADGSKAFTKIHGTQLDLWLKVQHMLELPDELPATKILPRRLAVLQGKTGFAQAESPGAGDDLVRGGRSCPSLASGTHISSSRSGIHAGGASGSGDGRT